MFQQTKKFIPYNNKLNKRAGEYRRNQTVAEKKLWFEFLRNYKYRFVRQKVIKNYILDFYCQKLKLGIEVDGETHYGDKNEDYDKKRTRELAKYGVEIIRFWNGDVLKGLGVVEEIIENKIKKREVTHLTPFIPLSKGDNEKPSFKRRAREVK